ncbi:hypothetical protein HY570_02745 [Candidatus Micrarchaeota archaeon]|nr:hypothetical protein [Candidatus Micrarchaeota archaeon]
MLNREPEQRRVRGKIESLDPFTKKEELNKFLFCLVALLKDYRDCKIGTDGFKERIVLASKELKDEELVRGWSEWLDSGELRISSEIKEMLKRRGVYFDCELLPNFFYFYGEIESLVKVGDIEFVNLSTYHTDREMEGTYSFRELERNGNGSAIIGLPLRSNEFSEDFIGVLRGDGPFGMDATNMRNELKRIFELDGGNVEELEVIIGNFCSIVGKRGVHILLAYWYAKHAIGSEDSLTEEKICHYFRLCSIFENIHAIQMEKALKKLGNWSPGLVEHYKSHEGLEYFMSVLTSTAFGPIPFYRLYRGAVQQLIIEYGKGRNGKRHASDSIGGMDFLPYDREDAVKAVGQLKDRPGGTIVLPYTKRVVTAVGRAEASIYLEFLLQLQDGRVAGTEQEFRSFSISILDRLTNHFFGRDYEELCGTGRIFAEYMEKSVA